MPRRASSLDDGGEQAEDGDANGMDADEAAEGEEALEDFFKSNIRASSSGDPLGCLGDLGWYCVRFGLFAFGWDNKPLAVSAKLASPGPGRPRGEVAHFREL